MSNGFLGHLAKSPALRQLQHLFLVAVRSSATISATIMAMSPDQTADLWLKIDQLHLNYLKAEENTSKLEIRKRLEGKTRNDLLLGLSSEVSETNCCFQDTFINIFVLCPKNGNSATPSQVSFSTKAQDG